MDNAAIDNILKRSQLSVTDSRRKILELFQQHDGGLSHSDIDSNTDEKIDRVTIYRTLQTFVEKGIIHTIPTADNAVMYALCKDECTGGHHHDNHVHFICDICKLTYCLNSVVTPEVNLPQGFRSQAIDVVVTGICKNC